MVERTTQHERERPFDHGVSFEPDPDADPDRVLFSALNDVLPPPPPVDSPMGVFTAAEVPHPPMTRRPPAQMWLAEPDSAPRGPRIGWAVAAVAVAVLAGSWVLIARRGQDQIDGRVAVAGLNESRTPAERTAAERAAASTSGWVTFDVADEAAVVQLPGAPVRAAVDPAGDPMTVTDAVSTDSGVQVQLATRPLPADAPDIGAVTASQIATWFPASTATSVRLGPTIAGVDTIEAELGGDPEGRARCARSAERIVCVSVRWKVALSNDPAVIDTRRRIFDSFTPRP